MDLLTIRFPWSKNQVYPAGKPLQRVLDEGDFAAALKRQRRDPNAGRLVPSSDVSGKELRQVKPGEVARISPRNAAPTTSGPYGNVAAQPPAEATVITTSVSALAASVALAATLGLAAPSPLPVSVQQVQPEATVQETDEGGEFGASLVPPSLSSSTRYHRPPSEVLGDKAALAEYVRNYAGRIPLDLRGLDFSMQNLKGANLAGAQCDEQTNFTMADLTDTDLSGADFSTAVFILAILDGAKLNSSTRVPQLYSYRLSEEQRAVFKLG